MYENGCKPLISWVFPSFSQAFPPNPVSSVIVILHISRSLRLSGVHQDETGWRGKTALLDAGLAQVFVFQGAEDLLCSCMSRRSA